MRRCPPGGGSAAVLNGHWSTALSGLTTTSLHFAFLWGQVVLSSCRGYIPWTGLPARKTICPPHPGIPTVKQRLLPDLLSPCLSSQVCRREGTAR